MGDDAETDAAIDRADAWWAIAKAKSGDWKDLSNRVRSGVKLSPEERAFVADIIEGKIKRKNHRNVSFDTSARGYKAAFHVVWASPKGEATESAVAQAMQQFGISRRSVFAALARYRKDAEGMKDELVQFESAGPILDLWYRKATRQ